jgi:aminoglycoside phosphotransferase
VNNRQVPLRIERKIKDYRLVETLKGRLEDEILKYESKDGRNIYLKIGAGVSAESLEQEARALMCLKSKGIIIPKVIDFLHWKNKVFLLITGIDGLPPYKIQNMRIESALKIVAEVLRKLHQSKIEDGENLNTLDKDLARINKYLSLGVIDNDKFISDNEGKTPQVIYNFLVKNKNLHDKDSFTHGDYCLPNILIKGDEYGLIDFGECGPGDKYKDFSSMEVSIKRNFGAEWINIFYKYYDKKLVVDQEKIRYYQLIDQFDYCLNIEKYNHLTSK